MAKSFTNIRPNSGGGGGGAVDSVNGQTGDVVITKSSIGLGNVNNTSDANKPISTATQAALDLKQDLISGTSDRVARFNGSGEVTDINQRGVDDNGYYNNNLLVEPDDNTGGYNVNYSNIEIEPLQDSPNETWHVDATFVQLDPNSSGFQIGTNGQALRFDLNQVNHSGTSNVGAIEFIQNNFNIGNGTDPIEVDGLAYAFGFGQFNDNVTIIGPIQGYGFQPNISAGATFDSNQYLQAFYDNTNIGSSSPGHTSFNSSPIIAEIQSGRNYTGVNVSPTIPIFNSNSGMIGIAISGNLGTFGVNSYFNGISVNPNIDSARYAAGINVTMDNVTVYPGVAASIVIQDLTIAADLPSSDGNSVTIEYVGGGTAGSEIVSQLGLAFTIQIEDGVSTAQNIADALNAFIGFTTNLNVTISGTASNPQVIQGPTNLANGENAGTKQAAFFDGDVQVTGALTFGGALSIGQLNAYASLPMVNGGGNPSSIHQLISAPTVGDNVTLTTGDTFGINTASLITIGDNSSISTALVGVAALGLPAVISMGSGSTLDQLSGAIFAVSLDATAAGGTIDRMDLCRALTLPNGTTTVNHLRGFKFDLPFGDPGTVTHGFYEQPGAHNYFAGNLLIGGTPLSDDTVTNASVALEIKSTSKAFVQSRMTSTERDALTPINGMQIYNTTTDKFQGYTAGVWVDLH